MSRDLAKVFVKVMLLLSACMADPSHDRVLVSRPEDPGLGLGLKTACLVPTPVARLP